jgi:hypothetical protein
MAPLDIIRHGCRVVIFLFWKMQAFSAELSGERIGLSLTATPKLCVM